MKQDKFTLLAEEIKTLVLKQIEFGTINPLDVFPPTKEWAISGKGTDGVALLYLNGLVQKLEGKYEN